MAALTVLRPDSDRIPVDQRGDPVGLLAHLRSDRGQGVLEFAMVLPLLATVVLVCILFGEALYTYIQVTHAANEGARLAAVNQPDPNNSTFTSLSAALTSEFALPKNATIAICYPTGTQAVGDPVEVDVYTSASWVPIVNLGQIKAGATMRIEQDTSANTKLAATTTYDQTKRACKT